MGKKRAGRLTVFQDRCRYCHACVLACSMVHEEGNVSFVKARLSVHREITDNKVTMTICRHCPRPKCMDDCPPGAMSLDGRGMVVIDESLCTACGNCRRNCPFEAIIHIRDRNKFQKCDLCDGRAGGPVCIDVCPVEAIVFEQSLERQS